MDLVKLMGRDPDVNQETKSGRILKWKLYNNEQLGLEIIVSGIYFQNNIDKGSVQKIEVNNFTSETDPDSGMVCFYIKE